MKSLVLLGAAALAFAAGPALAQAGGGATPPPAPGGSAGGAGAADRLGIPDRDAGANAQQMMDRQGQLSHDFTPRNKKARAYLETLEEFANQSSDRRSRAFALRDDALADKPIAASAEQIRAELLQDMEDWRDAFKIDKEEYAGLRDQIIVEAGALTAAQWADRRAQWFELRDEWITQQVAALRGAAASGG